MGKHDDALDDINRRAIEAMTAAERDGIPPNPVFRGLAKLRAAIEDEGPNPEHHRDVMKLHRQQWPTLWAAIDELLGLARRL